MACSFAMPAIIRDASIQSTCFLGLTLIICGTRLLKAGSPRSPTRAETFIPKDFRKVFITEVRNSLLRSLVKLEGFRLKDLERAGCRNDTEFAVLQFTRFSKIEPGKNPSILRSPMKLWYRIHSPAGISQRESGRRIWCRAR